MEIDANGLYKDIKYCPKPLLTCRFDYNPDYEPIASLIFFVLLTFLIIPYMVKYCNVFFFNKVFYGDRSLGMLIKSKKKKKNFEEKSEENKNKIIINNDAENLGAKNTITKTESQPGKKFLRNKSSNSGWLSLDDFEKRKIKAEVTKKIFITPRKLKGSIQNESGLRGMGGSSNPCAKMPDTNVMKMRHKEKLFNKFPDKENDRMKKAINRRGKKRKTRKMRKKSIISVFDPGVKEDFLKKE